MNELMQARLYRLSEESPGREEAERKTEKKALVKRIVFSLSMGVLVVLVIVAYLLYSEHLKNQAADAIRLREADLALSSPSDAVNNAADIVLPITDHVTPLHAVTVSFFGREDVHCLTADTTIGELLDTTGIILGDTNVLLADRADPITEDTAIEIIEVHGELVEIQETIPYQTVYRYLPTIPKGEYRVVQYGNNGTLLKKYDCTIENGVETGRTLVSETVLADQVPLIYEVGSGGTFTGRDGVTREYNYYIDCTATYYTRASSPTTWGYITYSGIPVSEECIAVDPSVIPLLSTVYIYTMPPPGDPRADIASDYGVRIAADTGGGIVNNHIDIYLEDDSRAGDYFGWYGVINVRVYILELPS